MKQIFTNLKVLLTLLLLCGVSSVWAGSYTMTIDSSTSGNNNVHWTASTQESLTYQDITWNTSITGTSTIQASKSYCQIGSKNNPATQVSLSTTGFAGKTVTSIAVTCYCMSNEGPTLTVTAGSTTMIDAVALTKTTSTKITSTSGSSVSLGTSDAIAITFNSSASAAICISEINVEYEDAAGTKYSVTYNGNGATSGSVPTDANEYEKNATVTVLGNTGDLAKVGYTFDGWNTKADATGTGYAAGSTFNIQQNTTLYAKWNAIQYNITTNVVEGGSCAVMIGEIAAATATKGTKLTLSNSPAAGYKFEKYVIDYTNEKGEPDQSNITTSSYTMPASDITVTPVFSKLATYTITLNNRGNVTTIENVIENSNLYDALVGQEPSDEFDGYSFGGWSKVQKASADNFVSSSDLVTGDITLYAIYYKSEGNLSTSEVTSLSNLSAGLYILGSEKSTNTLMYMPNTESSGSNPALEALDLNEVSVDMVWNLTSTGTANEYYIRPYGNDEIGLGVTASTGANIRISSSYVNTKWTISESESVNWQFMSGNMYLAVYEDNAWRNYKNNTTNQNGKFHIYKIVLPKETYSLGLSYNRTVTEGNFGTICLPYDGTVEGATLYSIAGKEMDGEAVKNLVLEEEGEELIGGIPYIFKATASELKVSYTSDEYTDADNYQGLYGTYDAIDALPADGTVYVVSQNKFWCVNSAVSCGANRAYIVLSEVEEASAANNLIIGNGNLADGINAVVAAPANSKMYNLNGQAVGADYKGVVIMNGKKMFNK